MPPRIHQPLITVGSALLTGSFLPFLFFLLRY
jgi:hypothetical protein